MSAGNLVRGEVALHLPDGTLLLRPTFAALVAAEAEVGSLFLLLERAGKGDVRLGEMAAMFWHCLAEVPPERRTFEARLNAVAPVTLLNAYRGLLTAIFGDC